MNTNRRPLLIVVAVVLAAAAGLFAFDYLTQPRQAPPPPRTVVVAARAIAAREPIDPTMTTLQTVPADQVQPGSYSAVAALNGDVALVSIPAGSPLTSSNVGHASQLETAVHLRAGMRAMSIPVDEVKEVAGLIQPGDHVDVYAIVESRGNEPPQSLAILRNIRILAVGASTGATGTAANAPLAHTVTLEVTPQQAKTLSLADLNSTLRLALRPPAEPTRSTETDSFVLAAQAPAPQAGTPAEQEAAALAAIASKSNNPAQQQQQQSQQSSGSGSGVEFIYGDKVETNGNP
jgi:pilus assembly protein CpaB